MCHQFNTGRTSLSLDSVVAFLVQTTLQGKIEREITEKKLTEDQVTKVCCKHVFVNWCKFTMFGVS